MDFAKRLKSLRLDRNPKVYQKELADAVGVSRQAVTMWETGQRIPDHEILQRLADYFDVSVDYLLGRTNNRNGKNKGQFVADEESTFFRRLKNLSPGAQEKIRRELEWLEELEKKGKK